MSEYDHLNPFAGTDLWDLVHGLSMLRLIEEHICPPRDSMVWILPPHMLPGVTTAWGLQVHRADVPTAFLAHRIDKPT